MIRPRSLAFLAAVSFSTLGPGACSSPPEADSSRPRPRKDPTPAPKAPELSVPSRTSVAIASPASNEVFVTMKPTVELRGVASGDAKTIAVETSAGTKLVANGTSAWNAPAVPVALGQTRITVSAADARDSLVVVRTRQIGFVEPATIFPDGVVVGTKVPALVRVRLDPAATIDRASLAVFRRSAAGFTQAGALHDDGKEGDERAGDGVFSASIVLDEPTVGRAAFHVGATGPEGEEKALAFFVDVVEPLLPADLDAAHDFLGSLNAVFTSSGGDLNAVLAQVRASSLVVEHAVTAVDGEVAISLRMKGDIPAQWAKPLPAGYRGGPSAVPGSRSALFASPYLSTFKEWDEGPDLEKAFRANTCPAYDTGPGLITEKALTIATLRNLPDHGIVHISSHGGTWAAMRNIGTEGPGCDLDKEKCTQGFNWYNGPGTEVILYLAEGKNDPPSADRTQSGNYAAEMRQGRIGINYGSYFVTPKFFAALPKRFPTTALMFSICRGAFNGTMGDALVRKGAGVYLGFSEIVGSVFANETSETIWSCLLDNKANAGAGKTIAECLPATKCEAVNVPELKPIVCELQNGVISCAEVPQLQRAPACLRTSGDTSLKLLHSDDEGKACSATAPVDLCGDGKRTGTEACDKSDLGGATCVSLSGPGSAGTVACRIDCTLDASACGTCNNNGKREGAEACDGKDLGPDVCPDGKTVPPCGTNCLPDLGACPKVCNPNGVREGSESCDGTDFSGETCASQTGVVGAAGALRCTPECSIDTQLCGEPCPPAPAACLCDRDGYRDQGERCDGKDVLFVCEELGYASGAMGCDSDCRLDVSACVSFQCQGGAGNGKREGTESCDGKDLAGATCATALKDSRQKGTLGCLSNCTFDASGCALTCLPNGVKTADEACDGKDFGGATCASETGDATSTGVLSCNGDCSIDASACGTCNHDGRRDAGEECDGSDVDGATCGNFLGVPYATGVITCGPDCRANTDQCDAGHQCTYAHCTAVSPSGANGAPVSLPPFKPDCDSCTQQVCAANFNCCTTSWDLPCYVAAQELCGCP